MTDVVFGEPDWLLPTQLLTNHLANGELLFHPHRECLQELLLAPREVLEVGQEDTLKFEHRFVVETHVIDVGHRDAGARQAVGDRTYRKRRVLLDPAESFLLRRRDELPIPQKGRGAVVIEGGDAEDPGGHGLLRRVGESAGDPCGWDRFDVAIRWCRPADGHDRGGPHPANA